MLPRLFFTHFRETSFVAEDGGWLAGFLCGFLSQTYPDQAYVHFVGVAPDRRGDGLARDLYERSVALDPTFAPAWAQLGRCYRIIGKYIESSPGSAQKAEQAYQRALELNPRLTIAHKFYAKLESDTGNAEGAIVRLLTVATRHGNDPELFAGLVHACRYAGLYDESIAAHAEASRLDPLLETGFEQSLMLAGDVERLRELAPAEMTGGGDAGIPWRLAGCRHVAIGGSAASYSRSRR